jgi:hypothetical protein
VDIVENNMTKFIIDQINVKREDAKSHFRLFDHVRKWNK